MNEKDQPYSGKPCEQNGCDGVLRVETSPAADPISRNALAYG
jgi:hypothetical protein